MGGSASPAQSFISNLPFCVSAHLKRRRMTARRSELLLASCIAVAPYTGGSANVPMNTATHNAALLPKRSTVLLEMNPQPVARDTAQRTQVAPSSCDIKPVNPFVVTMRLRNHPQSANEPATALQPSSPAHVNARLLLLRSHSPGAVFQIPRRSCEAPGTTPVTASDPGLVLIVTVTFTSLEG